MRENSLVLGGNVSGPTAELALKHELHGDVDATVLGDPDHPLFNPSLVWLPFGQRTTTEITFKAGHAVEQVGVDFVVDAAEYGPVATSGRRPEPSTRTTAL